MTKFYWLNRFADKRKTFPKIKGTYLELLRIPDKAEKNIARLVKQIFSLKHKQSIKDTIELENEIELIIYKTYGLSFDEACLIEGNTEWMSREAYDQFTMNEDAHTNA